MIDDPTDIPEDVPEEPFDMPKVTLRECERLAQAPLSRHFDLQTASDESPQLQLPPWKRPLADMTTATVQPDAKEDKNLSILEDASEASDATDALYESSASDEFEGDCDFGEVEEFALTDGSVYSGQLLRGVPDGDGLKAWPDGKRYQGEFQGGSAHGTGTCFLADGSKYVGPWMQNLPHGSKGFIHLANGEFYLGEFVAGMEHGEGTLTMPDRSTYSGQFSGGLKSGYGHEIYKASTTTKSHGVTLLTNMVLGSYEGEFENDHFEGEGTYKWNDGRRYEGQWHTNKMHGHGKYTFVDGRSYEGQYNHGEKSGMGTYLWPDGRSYVGQVFHGAQHGRGVYVNAKGNRVEGSWHHGRPASKATKTRRKTV